MFLIKAACFRASYFCPSWFHMNQKSKSLICYSLMSIHRSNSKAAFKHQLNKAPFFTRDLVSVLYFDSVTTLLTCTMCTLAPQTYSGFNSFLAGKRSTTAPKAKTGQREISVEVRWKYFVVITANVTLVNRTAQNKPHLFCGAQSAAVGWCSEEQRVELWRFAV